MHKLLLTSAALMTTILASPSLAEPQKAAESGQYIQQSKKAILTLKKALQKELKQALQSGGAEHAISVCNEKAPEIAAQIAKSQGLEIGRTSLKTRNPANVPDAWERQALKSFETFKSQGKSTSSLEAQEKTSTHFRYMKAIPMGGICATCHGTTISPNVQEKIQALYPEDQATGFKAGDIRGAFTVTIPVSQ